MDVTTTPFNFRRVRRPKPVLYRANRRRPAVQPRPLEPAGGIFEGGRGEQSRDDCSVGVGVPESPSRHDVHLARQQPIKGRRVRKNGSTLD